MRKPRCHPNKLYYAKNLCQSCYQKLWKKENLGRLRAYGRKSSKKWREANPTKIRRYKKKWRSNHPHDGRSRYRELRSDTIEKLGGVCVCCGESEKKFLTIEHVNGGGRQHRADRGTSGILRDIRDSGYDQEMFKVLCYNCNCSKGRWGYCPHQRRRISAKSLKKALAKA